MPHNQKTHDLKNILAAVREAQGTLNRALVVNQAPKYLVPGIEKLNHVATLIEKDLELTSQGVRDKFRKTKGAAVLRGFLTILGQAGCPVVSEQYDCLLGQMFVDLGFKEGRHNISVRIFETGELEYHNVDYNDPEVFAAQLGLFPTSGPGKHS